MKLTQKRSDIFIPDQSSVETALKRTTHLAIAAHPDDVEIMAYEGIAECFMQPDQWFTSVTVTDGSTAPRAFSYANYSNEQMAKTRAQEQRKAGILGEYSAVIQLGYTSAEVKDNQNPAVVKDFLEILSSAHPKVIYTHNLADKHDTHISVTLKLIEALRSLPASQQPQVLLGCEVWRDLDWLVDDDKKVMDVSAHPNLASALVSLYDTQNSGSKRYDLASIGRRTANAIYHESHGTGGISMLSFAMDLTPLMHDKELDPANYAASIIARFQKDVTDRIHKLMR
jgi:LmbE family N-acetylglucosaminyl deacetylase